MRKLYLQFRPRKPTVHSAYPDSSGYYIDERLTVHYRVRHIVLDLDCSSRWNTMNNKKCF